MVGRELKKLPNKTMQIQIAIMQQIIQNEHHIKQHQPHILLIFLSKPLEYGGNEMERCHRKHKKHPGLFWPRTLNLQKLEMLFVTAPGS